MGEVDLVGPSSEPLGRQKRGLEWSLGGGRKDHLLGCLEPS